MLSSLLREFAEGYALSPRPSKTRLHRLLKKDLGKTQKEKVAADIAAQNFMNTRFFKNDVYFGVDIDKEALEKGIDSMDEKNYRTDFISAPVSREEISDYSSKESRQKVAVNGNILESNLFPSNSINVLVSTNTLMQHHIDPENYYSIIQNFCDYVAKDGHMYLNMVDDNFTNEIHRYLLSEYENVELIPYNNKISDMWETYLESEDGTPSLANNKVIFRSQYVVTLILSKVELIHSETTRKSYIRCERKL